MQASFTGKLLLAHKLRAFREGPNGLSMVHCFPVASGFTLFLRVQILRAEKVTRFETVVLSVGDVWVVLRSDSSQGEVILDE
jgi:hypothetical protein